MNNSVDFDKKQYKRLKARGKATGIDGVKFYVCEDVGMVFAWFQQAEYSRTVNVTWSVCSPTDTFSKKVGKYQALKRLEQGIWLPLPISEEWEVGAIVEDAVEDILGNLVDSIYINAGGYSEPATYRKNIFLD